MCQLAFTKRCRGCFAHVIRSSECIFICIPCDCVLYLHRLSCRWELQRIEYVGPLTLRKRCRKASKHMSLDCWYACFHLSASSSFQHATDSITVPPCEPHCYSHTDAATLLLHCKTMHLPQLDREQVATHAGCNHCSACKTPGQTHSLLPQMGNHSLSMPHPWYAGKGQQRHLVCG